MQQYTAWVATAAAALKPGALLLVATGREDASSRRDHGCASAGVRDLPGTSSLAGFELWIRFNLPFLLICARLGHSPPLLCLPGFMKIPSLHNYGATLKTESRV